MKGKLFFILTFIFASVCLFAEGATGVSKTGLTIGILAPAILGILLIISEVMGKTTKFKANGVLQAIIGILKLLTTKKK